MKYVIGKDIVEEGPTGKSKSIITHSYYMGKVYRRTFIVGDLVTIAPDFRNSVLDFDFERYIGIIITKYEENEYAVHWTNSPNNNYYKGMWNGDHLVKIENYQSEYDRIKDKRLHIIEL